MRSCTVQMNRSVEIIGILRIGLENMLSKTNTLRVNYTRIFNFQESRVSLRMEVSEGELPYVPMGRIDVVELPTNNGRISCNCTLTQLQSGQSERIVLRLKDANQREKECQRVFGFFRKILSIPEEKTPKRVGVEKSKPETGGRGRACLHPSRLRSPGRPRLWDFAPRLTAPGCRRPR